MKFLTTDAGRRIAYVQSKGIGPGLVFLGGFMSDMTGTKALHLEAWCKAEGRGFLRFDYSGHGASSEAFTDGCIGDWAEDAQAAICELTQGRQILVGSSMGGWISLLMTKRISERIAGLVTIAAAPDFTEDGFWASFNADTRKFLIQEGQVNIPRIMAIPIQSPNALLRTVDHILCCAARCICLSRRGFCKGMRMRRSLLTWLNAFLRLRLAMIYSCACSRARITGFHLCARWP